MTALFIAVLTRIFPPQRPEDMSDAQFFASIDDFLNAEIDGANAARSPELNIRRMANEWLGEMTNAYIDGGVE